MKTATMIIVLFTTLNAMGAGHRELPFKEPIRLKRVFVKKALPTNLYEAYQRILLKGRILSAKNERMIAKK